MAVLLSVILAGRVGIDLVDLKWPSTQDGHFSKLVKIIDISSETCEASYQVFVAAVDTVDVT